MKIKIFASFILLLVSVSSEYIVNYCETILNCGKDPSYPENVLKTLDLSKYHFNGDEFQEEIKKALKTKRSVDLNSDRNQYLIETKLCDSLISFKRPRLLKNINNEWRTIVNHDNITQLIRHEECLSVNFPCTYNIYPKNVRSFCHQSHSTLTLWTFDERRNTLVMDKFNVPTTCDCAIEKEDLFKGVKNDLLQRP